jgi:hypothetical protein
MDNAVVDYRPRDQPPWIDGIKTLFAMVLYVYRVIFHWDVLKGLHLKTRMFCSNTYYRMVGCVKMR